MHAVKEGRYSSLTIAPYTITNITVFHSNHKFVESLNSSNSSVEAPRQKNLRTGGTGTWKRQLHNDKICSQSRLGKGYCTVGMTIYRSDGFVLRAVGSLHVVKQFTYAVKSPNQFAAFQGDTDRVLEYIEPVKYSTKVSGSAELDWEPFACSGATCSEDISYGVSDSYSTSSTQSVKTALAISVEEDCIFEKYKVKFTTAHSMSKTVMDSVTTSASTTKHVTCGPSDSTESWNIWQFYARADPFGTGGHMKYKNGNALFCFPYNVPKPKCLPHCCAKLPPDGYCQTCRTDCQ